MKKIIFILLIGFGTVFEGFTQLKFGPYIGFGQVYIENRPSQLLRSVNKKSAFYPLTGIKSELPLRTENFFLSANVHFLRSKNKASHIIESQKYLTLTQVSTSLNLNYLVSENINVGIGFNYLYGVSKERVISTIKYFFENVGVNITSAYRIKKVKISLMYTIGIIANDKRKIISGGVALKPINAISLNLAYLFETKLFNKYY